jgi:hypothetical protein
MVPTEAGAAVQVRKQNEVRQSAPVPDTVRVPAVKSNGQPATDLYPAVGKPRSEVKGPNGQ